jgi:predicted nucleic acid-binding protein
LIAAFDASVLVFLLTEKAGAPLDAATGQPVDRCQARVSYLLAELQRNKAKIVIPAPALAEVLVYGEAQAPEWLRTLNSSKHFRIAPFDDRAAVEYASLERERLKAPPAGGRRKAKFDEQIVAIATVEQADVIYSDDADIRKLVGDRIPVRGLADLELPPTSAQGWLELRTDDEASPAERD